MELDIYTKKNIDNAWCPGCGNFKILEIIKTALSELGISPENLVVSSGVGQAPKTPHYFNTNMFNGLHGRALPVATAIKAVNPELTVIAEGGDGDMYGEGGNHFLHTIRRNPDIVHLVHNNMVYGLTKGQASPTSQIGFVTPLQIDGVFEEPVNPIAVAIAQNASFVARSFSNDKDQSVDILKQAIQHKGYSLIDMFQPCVSFNKINNATWFKENIEYLKSDYDPTNRNSAFEVATQTSPYKLGVIFKIIKPTFEEKQFAYKSDTTPIIKRKIDFNKLDGFFNKRL